jgi:hypothetical protein
VVVAVVAVVVAVVTVVVGVVVVVGVEVEVEVEVEAVVVAVASEKPAEPLVEAVEAAATGVVASDVAIVDPFLFVAVTATLNAQPRSPATSTYVGAVSPTRAMHAAPELSQRFHW